MQLKTRLSRGTVFVLLAIVVLAYRPVQLLADNSFRPGDKDPALAIIGGVMAAGGVTWTVVGTSKKYIDENRVSWDPPVREGIVGLRTWTTPDGFIKIHPEEKTAELAGIFERIKTTPPNRPGGEQMISVKLETTFPVERLLETYSVRGFCRKIVQRKPHKFSETQISAWLNMPATEEPVPELVNKTTLWVNRQWPLPSRAKFAENDFSARLVIERATKTTASLLKLNRALVIGSGVGLVAVGIITVGLNLNL